MESAAPNARATMPTMSSDLSRRLPWLVVGAVVTTATVSVGLILFTGRSDWWAGLLAASVVAFFGAAASMTILRRAAGQRIDLLATYVMAASFLRVAISVIGLIVAVKLFKAPPDATGFMICGYYAAMLVAETTLVARATRSAGRGAAVKLGERNA